MSRDRGSASVLVLAAGLVVVLIGLAVATVASAVVARHRAQAAADLGALAGAARAIDGETAACARAAQVVAYNLARLTGCRAVGLDLIVTAEVAGPAGLSAYASARAGPVEDAWTGGLGPRRVAFGRLVMARCPRGLPHRQKPRRWARRSSAPLGGHMELSLATRAVADHTVLEIGGEIDVYTAPSVRERLTELFNVGARRVVVDLHRVEFLDSTGIGVLVGAQRRLQASDGSLALVCPHERLLKIFRITGLDSVFDIHDSIESAIAAPN